MDKVILPRALKIELPDQVIGMVEAVRTASEAISVAFWWSAFVQGLVVGAVFAGFAFGFVRYWRNR